MKKSITIYVAYNHRFEPHWMSTKKLLEENKVGKIYKVNLYYGNGTAELVRLSNWRDTSLGVIADLGSHLIDLLDYWFELSELEVRIVTSNKFENNAFDNAILKFEGVPESILEVSLVSWKNEFRAELIGEYGSIHIDGLCKWGPSSLTIRSRKHPSGIPDQNIHTLICQDPTWEKEYVHFKKLVEENSLGNLLNNQRVSDVLFEVQKMIKI